MLELPEFRFVNDEFGMLVQDGTTVEPGIIPRALADLFRQVSLDNSSSFTFSMSMLEVYMGNLRDLLASKPALRANETLARW